MQLRLECPPFLFEQTIGVPLDLLIFVIDRLTFCPIDEPKLLANLSVEALLVLAQLLDASILPQVLQLLEEQPARSTRIDHAAHSMRGNDQVPS